MYKTILPSSLLQFAEKEYYSGFSNALNNTALRMGVVKNVSYPDDKTNLEKSAPEYDVLVFQQDSDKGVIPITYRNCVTMDMFGGVSDFFEFVKGEPTDKTANKLDLDDGSYVLLLCIDGTASRGVILGALPHHNRKSTLPKTKAKHLEGEYNGLRIKINDDGELTMTFKGKTDTKGKPTTTTGGSQIKMEKDGSIELNTRDLDGVLKGNDKENKDTSIAGAEYEKIRLDKATKKIAVSSRGDYVHDTGGNSSHTVKGNTTQKMTDILVDASGKATINSGGMFTIKSGGELSITATGAKFTLDSSLEIKASIVKIGAQQISLGEGGDPAVVMSTQSIGIGNMGAPVVSTFIGPYSSVVMIAM